jgi:hypothetical protein
VIVEVEEAKRPFTGDLGVFSKPEVRSDSSFFLKESCLKNCCNLLICSIKQLYITYLLKVFEIKRTIL